MFYGHDSPLTLTFKISYWKKNYGLFCDTTKRPPSAMSYSYCLVVECASPELVGDEDDPSLQQQRCKDLQQPPHAQALQQTLKVHVLQPGVHWPTQSQRL